MINHLVAEALEILREAGLAADVQDNAPHYKIRFTNAFGRRCTLIISRSPSNRNAAQENRAVLRRLLRENGESPQC
jgi:hypothetical protein